LSIIFDNSGSDRKAFSRAQSYVGIPLTKKERWVTFSSCSVKLISKISKTALVNVFWHSIDE